MLIMDTLLDFEPCIGQSFEDFLLIFGRSGANSSLKLLKARREQEDRNNFRHIFHYRKCALNVNFEDRDIAFVQNHVY